MGADEEGTHERLRAHLRELIEPKIKEHRGRIVKNTGDGFLAEFASVIDAVRCSVEMQRAMASATKLSGRASGSTSAWASTSAMSYRRARTSLATG
jgi:class 3 adenylate cyclase